MLAAVGNATQTEGRPWTKPSPPFGSVSSLNCYNKIVEHSPDAIAGARILVVDDDPDNRAMIGHFLGNWGYSVDYANNGKLALEKVKESAPQLVLLDLEMPEMDGFETCERLKTDPATEWIPVVIFTGLEKLPHRLRGFRDGADDYVVKSAQPEELRSRIELVLRRAHKYSELSSTADAEPDALAAAGDSPDTRAESEPERPAAISLEETSFPEAMQLALAQNPSATLRFQDKESLGSVHLANGEIVDAATSTETGEDAFYALALWSSGTLEIEAPEEITRTIHTPTRGLLVEASRRNDAWRMISSKVPSFDLVPRTTPFSGSPSIRLTKSDWAVMRLADGSRSISAIVDELETDIFEAGRVVFSLLTVGVIRLEEAKETLDKTFDMVPVRGESLTVEEPFELTVVQWEILARIDRRRTLRDIRNTMDISPGDFLAIVRDLGDKGFLSLFSPELPSEEM